MQNLNIMKTCNTFIRNLRLSAGILLCIAGALLAPPPSAFAQEPEPVQAPEQAPEQVPAPTVSGLAITSTPTSNGYYKAGETIQATVTFSKNVTGTPTLTVNIGGTAKTANYTGGSGTATLAFAYTVVPGDEDTDGISIDGLSGTVEDDAGNTADLTNATLGAQASHKVDTTIPIVSSVAMSSAAVNGIYKAGETIQVTVTFSESVTGTPQLTLNLGGIGKPAAYVSGSGTTQLVFGYTVVPGDADTDGISVDGLLGAVTDTAGNLADLTNAVLPAQATHSVDATAPVVSGVAMTSAAVNGIYKAGDVIQAMVSFSEAVAASDRPQLTLNVGGIGKPAAYVSGIGTPQLVFAYTVVPGDADTDGISVDGLLGAVTDTAGNLADLTNAVLPAQATHSVDAVSPTVNTHGIAITSIPNSHSTYKIGDTIQVTVTFSETLNVTLPAVPPHLPPPVPPQLTLTIGAANKQANYTSGSGTATLVFEYTVVSGDEDTDGISIAPNQLSLNNGTITDSAGNAATLTHTPLAPHPSHSVDTTVPGVSAVAISSTAVNGVYKIGETIQAVVSFSEVVVVSDLPQLTLNIGGVAKPAAYASGSGTPQLVFGYTVVSGDEDTDGISIDGLAGTVTDTTGNLADLTNAVLAAQATHKVDTSVPTVSSVAMTSVAPNGTYKLGETIQAAITFSEVVMVSDVPQLALTIGAVYRNAVYVSGSGTTQLVFGYTVVAGDEDIDGISIEADKLAGTITDVTGNGAVLTHAALGAQATHKVDTSTPTVSSVAMTSAATNGTYKLGEAIQATVTFSEIVVVSDLPQLTLNLDGIGKSAVYTSGAGTASLVFGYTVVSGDEDTDGVSIDGLSGTIVDGAGNPADLTNATLGAQASHQVDAVVPTVSSVAMSSTPNNGTYTTGDTIQATVTFDEAVNVTGVPQLTLTIGTENKTANWTSGDGTASLVFGYTVVLGDEDTDGVSIDGLSGTIADAAGNAADLTNATLATQASHQVDTTPPQQPDEVSGQELVQAAVGAPVMEGPETSVIGKRPGPPTGTAASEFTRRGRPGNQFAINHQHGSLPHGR